MLLDAGVLKNVGVNYKFPNKINWYMINII